MSHWYCRECKRAHREDQMLPGWNGPWCPNCVWDNVAPAPDGLPPAGDATLPTSDAEPAAAP